MRGRTPEEDAVASAAAIEESIVMWRNYTLPPRYRRAVADHPEVSAWVRDYVRGASANLLLVGPVGTGKSWQAWGAISEIGACSIRAERPDEQPGYRSLVGHRGLEAGSVMDLLDRVRATYDGKSDDDRGGGPMERMRKSALLLLDDVGAERMSDWARERLSLILDDRWNAQRPTIVTTNLTDLRGYLGERMASRLAGDAAVVVMDGEDRRRQAS